LAEEGFQVSSAGFKLGDLVVRDDVSRESPTAALRNVDAGYEAPELVALGNLHDLLAGEGGTRCDGNGDTTDGNASVVPTC
jgi:hypothetical protein